MSFKTGKRNLITDVAGLTVGNADDLTLKSGVTVVLCDKPTTAAVQVLGGAPGTSETDLLEPHNTVQTVDALVLSGGYGSGLAVFDVSADRFAPTYRRYARTNGYSVSITQEGETLFLAGGPYGIQTVALTE